MSKKQTQKNKNSQVIICSHCGAVIPSSVSTCLICGTKKSSTHTRENSALSTSTHTTTESFSPSATPTTLHKTKIFPRLLASTLSVIFLVVAVGMGAFQNLNFARLNSVYNTQKAFLYLQSSGELKMKLPSVEKPQLITTELKTSISSERGNMLGAKDSFDHRFISYLNNQSPKGNGVRGDLYLLDLINLNDKNPETNRGVLVSPEQVTDFIFSPEEHLLAFVTVSEELYICNYKPMARLVYPSDFSVEKVDDNVGGLVRISGKELLYYKGNNTSPSTLSYNQKTLVETAEPSATGNSFDLYKVPLHHIGYPVQLIDKGVYTVADSSREFQQVFYTKLESGQSLPTYSLYLYDEKAETPSQLLARNVAYIVEANASLKQVAYLSPNESTLRFNSFFLDDLAKDDEKMEDPSTLPPLSPNSTESEMEERDIAIDEYQDKVQRDKLRSYLQKQLLEFKTSTHMSYSLYHYNVTDGEPTLVDSSIFHLQPNQDLVKSDLEKGYLLYVSGLRDNIELLDIAQWDAEDIQNIISAPFNIPQHLAEHMPESLELYTIANQNTTLLYHEQGPQTISNFYINDTLNEVSFLSRPFYEIPYGTLYVATLNKSELDKVVYIDDQVNFIIGRGGPAPTGILYQVQSRDDSPLYAIYNNPDNAGSIELATDTAGGKTAQLVGTNSDKLLYFKNYDSYREVGELYLLEDINAPALLLGTKIYQYAYYNRDNILLVQLENDGTYTLVRAKKDSNVLLEEGIESYQAFDQTFFPYHT